MKLINRGKVIQTIDLHTKQTVSIEPNSIVDLGALPIRIINYYKKFEDLGLYIISKNTPIVEENATEHSPLNGEGVLSENLEDNAVKEEIAEEITEPEPEQINSQMTEDIVTEEVSGTESDASLTESETPDYSSYSISKLKRLADKKGLKYSQNATKKQLIKLLLGE